MHWLTLAKDLAVNSKIQTRCPEDCGSGEKLSVQHNVRDYWCYCYRCGYTQTVHKGEASLKELAHIKQLNEAAKQHALDHTNKLELPNDYDTNIPIQGRLWLYEAGITESVWKEHHIGYSEHLGRVVLPVYDDNGNLVWYQCRAVHEGQTPKYIQPSRGRDNVYFLKRPRSTDMHRAVIVEDILSAI